MTRTARSRPLRAVLALSTVVALGATLTQPAASASGGDATGDREPLYDFTDAYYRSHGVRPEALVGRRDGQDGLSVVDDAPDDRYRDVRVLLTLPAYDHSGDHEYWTVLSDLAADPFTDDAAGRAARRLAERSPIYVFPTLDGDPTGVGDNRQADLIDLRHGYFSNNPLALWVHVFVTWEDAAFDTARGRKQLRRLEARNGESLDGTPIIDELSELKDLRRAGLVTLTKRGVDEQGRYFICPVFKDPRRGGIAEDAFLATVRDADGDPLAAEQEFVDDFESLRTTGEHADG